MKQLNKHINQFVAPSFSAGTPLEHGRVKNMNKRCYPDFFGVISKGSVCTIKGVNALTCFSNFIPRPEGRGYGYAQFRYLRM